MIGNNSITFSYILNQIKTYYGTIKDSTIWIEDSETSIKIVLNTSTKATVYINRLLWYSLNIDKVYIRAKIEEKEVKRNLNPKV